MRKSFRQFLNQVINGSNIRVFLTSRPHILGTFGFGEHPTIENKAHDSDLRKYMQSELSRNGVTEIVDEKFAAEIVEKIVQNAHGM